MLWLTMIALGQAADVLPVRRVRFYETGVAWFEREGRVVDATSLPVPRSHLDDALKSLVVLGGDADVNAITFPSAISDAAARADAGIDGAERMGFGQAIGALVGLAVEVRRVDGGLVVGTLLDLEGPLPRAAADDGRVTPPEYALTVLSPRGVQRLLTTEVQGVSSREAEVAGRLARRRRR